MKACSNRLVKIFLVWLWVTAEADARTWRIPTARLATLRGGDDNMIPIVPVVPTSESITTSNVLPRGGSVTTTKKPKLSTTTSSIVTGTRSVHVVASAGATTLPAVAMVEPAEPIVLNATIVTTQSSVEKPATVANHKRHKWIAKKLKVSRNIR